MRDYYLKKYNWKDKVVDKIWWEIQGKELQTLSQNQRTIIHKFIHNKLPCNKTENLYYKFRSPNCYTCNDTIECQSHIIRCPNCSRRKKIRKNYIQALRRHLETTSTNNTTIRCIMFYLNAWLCQINPPGINEIAPDASETLIEAINHQNNIGWDQWMYGRISIHWGELYNHDRKNKMLPSHKTEKLSITSTSWGKSINIITWNFLIAFWCCRNNSEHQSNHDLVKRKKEKIIEKIMWLKSQLSTEQLKPHK
jgi:Zn finger protein HypA/HybF involved in hydrogenase expression